MPIQVFKNKERPSTVTEMIDPPGLHTYQIEANETYIVQATNVPMAVNVVLAYDPQEFIVEVKDLYQATILIYTPDKAARKTKTVAKPKKKKLSAAQRQAISEGMKRSYARRQAPPPTHIGEPFKDD